MSISFAANLVVKPKRLIARDAPKSLCHPPRAGQRMIDGGNIVVKQVLVGLVEVDALLNNGLVVLMQRDTGGMDLSGPESLLQECRSGRHRRYRAIYRSNNPEIA